MTNCEVLARTRMQNLLSQGSRHQAFSTCDTRLLPGSTWSKKLWQWSESERDSWPASLSLCLFHSLEPLTHLCACCVLWTQAEKVGRSPGECVLAKPGLCQNSKHQKKASSLVSMTTCPPCPCNCSPSQALWWGLWVP